MIGSCSEIQILGYVVSYFSVLGLLILTSKIEKNDNETFIIEIWCLGDAVPYFVFDKESSLFFVSVAHYDIFIIETQLSEMTF